MTFYRLQPVWDGEHHKDWESFFDCVLHTLFDGHGEIDWVEDGFCCTPDAAHAGSPVVTVNKVEKIICFALSGFPEKEAGEIIQSAVESFGETFATDLGGITVECWDYDIKKGKSFFVASRDISDKKITNPNMPRFFNYKTGNA
ncbi:MAG: hypothetical protein AAB730_00480 [Patescibacteria group bacterium]